MISLKDLLTIVHIVQSKMINKRRSIILFGVVLLNSLSCNVTTEKVCFNSMRDRDNTSCENYFSNMFKEIIAERYKGSVQSCDINIKGE